MQEVRSFLSVSPSCSIQRVFRQTFARRLHSLPFGTCTHFITSIFHCQSFAMRVFRSRFSQLCLISGDYWMHIFNLSLLNRHGVMYRQQAPMFEIDLIKVNVFSHDFNVRCVGFPSNFYNTSLQCSIKLNISNVILHKILVRPLLCFLLKNHSFNTLVCQYRRK